MENNKSAEAGSNPVGGPSAGQAMNSNGGANPDPSTIPIPKLGMAPLSSELAVAASSNNVPAEILQPSNRTPPDTLQSTDLQNTQTAVPLTVNASHTDPVPTDPSTIPVAPEPEQAPQMNEPLSSPPDTTAPLPDPIPTVGRGEQSQLPDSDPIPSDPPPPDPPINQR